MSEFDICVFGATGFTGRFVVKQLLTFLLHKRQEVGDLKICIAGRNRTKLEELKKVVAADLAADKETNYDELISKLGMLVADSGDKVLSSIRKVGTHLMKASMTNLAQRSAVVINCTGPFRFYGEAVVSACVEAGSSYVDICGEPEFLERMTVKYHDAAVKNGSIIIICAGFDCVPADLGSLFNLRAHPPGSVPHKMQGYLTGNTPGGIHRTTWTTFVHSISHVSELRALRKKELASKPRPAATTATTTSGPAPKVSGFHKASFLNGWAIPFPSADAAIVRKSNKSADYCTPNFRYGHYLVIQRWWKVLAMAVFAFCVTFIAKFKLGAQWLINHPPYMFSDHGPQMEDIKKSWFRMTFVSESKDWKVTTAVQGPEPGYVTTAFTCVLSAILILRERKSLPAQAGVLTPAQALGQVGINKLVEFGKDINFEFVTVDKKPLR